MDELVAILGALIILVLSIAGIKVYRWRTDVLTGPYISNWDHDLTNPDKRTDRPSRPTVKKWRTMRLFLQGWNSDALTLNARRSVAAYFSNQVTDPNRLRARLRSAMLSVKGLYSKETVARRPAKCGSTSSENRPTRA